MNRRTYSLAALAMTLAAGVMLAVAFSKVPLKSAVAAVPQSALEAKPVEKAVENSAPAASGVQNPFGGMGFGGTPNNFAAVVPPVAAPNPFGMPQATRPAAASAPATSPSPRRRRTRTNG